MRVLKVLLGLGVASAAGAGATASPRDAANAPVRSRTQSVPTSRDGAARRNATATRRLALWPPQPAGHFVLLGTQRTGTTWIMSEFARRSPCVVHASELFIQYDWSRPARQACLALLYRTEPKKALGGAPARRQCSPRFRQFLDRTAAFAEKHGHRTVAGFKWMQSVEKDWPWLKRLWKEKGVRVVTLRRRNHVRTVLSRVTNRKTGDAHPTEAKAAAIGRKKIKLETTHGALYKHLRTVSRSYNELGHFHDKVKAAGIPAALVAYEDLVGPGGDAALASLRDFVLGPGLAGDERCAPSIPVAPERVHRIHGGSLRDEISNYDEVVSKLAGTPYAKSLDEAAADEAAAGLAALVAQNVTVSN